MDKFGIKWLDDALDEIDAALFSGDTFFDKQAAEKMQRILNRWNKQLKICIEMGRID